MIKKKYPRNKPELKKLLNGRSLKQRQFTGYDFQGRCFCVYGKTLKKNQALTLFFFFFFKNGPGRTVMCSLHIYTSKYLKQNFTVRCKIFSLRTYIGKQTITFFATTAILLFFLRLASSDQPNFCHFQKKKKVATQLNHFSVEIILLISGSAINMQNKNQA